MKAQRTPGEQWRDDPMRRARMLVAGLFGAIPATLAGLEIADLAAKVIEPIAAYVRAHPPSITGGPTWMSHVGPTWHAFVSEKAYLPWTGWPPLLHHPALVAGALGLGAVLGGLMMIVAGRARYLSWGGPASTGKGQYGSAHWRPSSELGQTNGWWSAPKVDKKTGTLLAAQTPRKSGKTSATLTLLSSGLLVGADATKHPTGGWILERDEHALIMAITRAGKTRRVILPTIGVMGLAGRDSMVITDPKGEIVRVVPTQR